MDANLAAALAVYAFGTGVGTLLRELKSPGGQAQRLGRALQIAAAIGSGTWAMTSAWGELDSTNYWVMLVTVMLGFFGCVGLVLYMEHHGGVYEAPRLTA